MKKSIISFYISSHGFGHLTRCLAIIEEILQKTKFSIYIACNKKQNEFAKVYLTKYKERLIFSDLLTDVGLINFPKTLQVDIKTLQSELYNFISSWEYLVSNECNFLEKFNVKFIVNDISPIGALVAEKLNVKCYGVSNFTWVEQYENFGLDINIINNFKYAYSKINEFIEYELAMEMNNKNTIRHKVGFISRKIDYNRVAEINNKYGESIFITCGKSANLKDIKIQNYENNVFSTSGINVIHKNVERLPENTIDTHNYINASKIVIAKAGWGTIAESLISGKITVLIERPGVFEDTHMLNLLKERNLAISIPENALFSLDIKDLYIKAKSSINFEILYSFKNEVDKVIKLLKM